MSLVVQSNTADNRLLVRVSGEVDVSNAPELRAALNEGLGQAPDAVSVDLAEVSYIDSTGIGVLVGAAHHASDAGIAFSVERPQRNVARVLAMLGVDTQLGLQSDES